MWKRRNADIRDISSNKQILNKYCITNRTLKVNKQLGKYEYQF